jgi:hypothetical protein
MSHVTTAHIYHALTFLLPVYGELHDTGTVATMQSIGAVGLAGGPIAAIVIGSLSLVGGLGYGIYRSIPQPPVESSSAVVATLPYRTICLKGSNGKYLRAHGGGGGCWWFDIFSVPTGLAADADVVYAWEKFTVHPSRLTNHFELRTHHGSPLCSINSVLSKSPTLELQSRLEVSAKFLLDDKEGEKLLFRFEATPPQDSSSDSGGGSTAAGKRGYLITSKGLFLTHDIGGNGTVFLTADRDEGITDIDIFSSLNFSCHRPHCSNTVIFFFSVVFYLSCYSCCIRCY